MKQDRRLNNGLLMHVNNLIMNDPDTVKVTSKHTVFFIFFFLGNLSRGKRLAWCTISPPHLPRQPLTLTQGSDAFELGPKNNLYS